MNHLSSMFKNQVVLVSGHTGFKGSWLCLWLHSLGARVVGVSKEITTSPSHYEHTKNYLSYDLRANIEDKDTFSTILKSYKPVFIFHLAAQAIVVNSFKEPYQTFSTNTLGTLNLLEALRNYPLECSTVLITSDKSYQNRELDRGYHEEDRLGGEDPYSGSKGAAELIINSYYHSFFIHQSKIKIGIARAGNVVGGGDWSIGRLIPDAIRAWTKQESLLIRNPESTRPWQHVLEPLFGYLQFATSLQNSSISSGTALNFGPSSLDTQKVFDVANLLKSNLEKFSWHQENLPEGFHESKLLALDSSKAKAKLNWQTHLSIEEVIQWTATWYKNFYSDKQMNCADFSRQQIDLYTNRLNDD
jgi:CDP-glucose 4,6-dehydratase